VCCPCAIQIRPFGLSYGLFFTTQGPESRQSHESTKFRRDGLPLSYGQITKSASADPNTNCSYESFRMGKSNAPDPCANCPYDRKVGAVSTKFRRCEGLPVDEGSVGAGS
jgi:hypothetical protein